MKQAHLETLPHSEQDTKLAEINTGDPRPKRGSADSAITDAEKFDQHHPNVDINSITNGRLLSRGKAFMLPRINGPIGDCFCDDEAINVVTVRLHLAICCLSTAFVVYSALGAACDARATNLFYAADCLQVSSLDPATDLDEDGISDSCEQDLAEKFAPIIFHSSDESNYPTNVDWFLARTKLAFASVAHPELNRLISDKVSQHELLGHAIQIGTQSIRSDGTRSQRKRDTFYLQDVDERSRAGSAASKDWTTYYHAYQNEAGGITVQYWRFYAYNDAFDNHGGDWEGIQIHLDNHLQPLRVGLLGHTSIDSVPFSEFQQSGGHVFIFSEGGGHASRRNGNGIRARNCRGGFFGSLFCTIHLNNPQTFTKQECWTGGTVSWFDGKRAVTGPLLNIGEKIKPLNEQFFIRYSGLWGSPSRFPASPTFFSFSGYWGPAFNETGMTGDGFIRAWCTDMAQPARGECLPDDKSE